MSFKRKTNKLFERKGQKKFEKCQKKQPKNAFKSKVHLPIESQTLVDLEISLTLD